jgi:type II secretory pathway pseudopilin PulG
MVRAKSGPPISAELGRPETAEEAADRKAEASRTRRQNQTTLNLVLALIATLAVVAVIVLVSQRPEQSARPAVDYQQIAAQAQPSVAAELASPTLADDWRANSARLDTGADGVTSWYIGFVTPEQQFIALRQGIDANATWLASQLPKLQPTGTATVGGLDWQVYDNRDAPDPGNLAYAMTAVVDGSTLVLSGTAATPEFETIATSLAEQLSKDE